jgi:hypothetical protein
LTFYGYGLNVVTAGDIAVDNVEANFNNLWGGSLTGLDVAVSDSQFNNNISDSTIFIDDTGLLIDSGGTVNLFNVEAKENRLIGADIQATGDVVITNSVFTDNRGFTCLQDWCPPGSLVFHGYGLNVFTTGNISLDGVTASNNNLFGAQLEGANVTVLNSTFSNNGMGNGLIVESTGNVSLTNITASDNGLNGVAVVSAACVQVTDGTFANNGQYGISVTNAPLNLVGTQVFANNGAGNIFQSTPGTCSIIIPASTTLGNNSSDTSLGAGNGSTTTVSNGNNTKVKKKHGHKKHRQGAKRRGRARR